LALLLAARHLTRSQHAETGQAPPAAMAIAAPAPAAAPAHVSVQVESTPRSAEVFVDDESKARGRTPLVLALARGTSAPKITVRYAGFAESVATLVPDADHRMTITLRRESRKSGKRERNSRRPANYTESVIDPF